MLHRQLTLSSRREHIDASSNPLMIIFQTKRRPYLLTGTMALAPVSTRDCEVTGALHADSYSSYSSHLYFSRVIDGSCGLFKRQGLKKDFIF